MKHFSHVEGLPVLAPLDVLEIDGKRYYVSPTGKKLPSVTTILSHFKTESLEKWRRSVGEEKAARVSYRAATRGTKFHSLCEKYVKNEPSLYEGVMPDLRQLFDDARHTIDRIESVRYVEAQLFSDRLGTAGRVDLVANFDSVLSIIDFKTSLREKKESWISNYFEQETCYALMYEEMLGEPIDQIVTIIAVDGQEKPQVFVKSKEEFVEPLLKKISTYKEEVEKNVS